MSRKNKISAEDEVLSADQQSDQQIRERFLARAGELLDAHWPEILEMIEEDEGNRATVKFSASIDKSESNSKLKTSITFSTSHKDERIDEIGDPNQLTLNVEGFDGGPQPGSEEPPTSGDGAAAPSEAPAEPKRKRGRPKKVVVTPEPEPEAA